MPDSDGVRTRIFLILVNRLLIVLDRQIQASDRVTYKCMFVKNIHIFFRLKVKFEQQNLAPLKYLYGS